MKLEVNIEKRHLYFFISFIVLVMGVMIAVAVKPNPGHSDAEIESLSASKIIAGSFANGIYSFPGSVGIGMTSGSNPTLQGSKLILQLAKNSDRGLRVTDGTLFSNIVIQPLAEVTSGFQAINFNGYYDAGEKRFNAEKNRWRIAVDQRSATDAFIIQLCSRTRCPDADVAIF